MADRVLRAFASALFALIGVQEVHLALLNDPGGKMDDASVVLATLTLGIAFFLAARPTDGGREG